jgi:hypothetical protein
VDEIRELGRRQAEAEGRKAGFEDGRAEDAGSGQRRLAAQLPLLQMRQAGGDSGRRSRRQRAIEVLINEGWGHGKPLNVRAGRRFLQWTADRIGGRLWGVRP